MAGQSQGAFSKLAIDGNQFCFESFKDMSVFQYWDGSEEAICGDLDSFLSRTGEGIVIPKFKIVMSPTPEEEDLLYPLAGFSESTDVFTPIDDFSSISFDVEAYKVASLDTFTGAMFDKLTWRGRKGGGAWKLEIEGYATGLTVDAGGTFSASSITKTSSFVFHQSVLNLNSGAEAFQSGVISLNNNLYVQHNNSQFPTSIRPQYREFGLGVDTPYTSDETALLTAFTGETDATPPGDDPSSTGYGGSVVCTRGGLSRTFTFYNLKSAAKLADIDGRTEIRNRMWFKAFGDASNKPMTITNDITA